MSAPDPQTRFHTCQLCGQTSQILGSCLLEAPGEGKIQRVRRGLGGTEADPHAHPALFLPREPSHLSRPSQCPLKLLSQAAGSSGPQGTVLCLQGPRKAAVWPPHPWWWCGFESTYSPEQGGSGSPQSLSVGRGGQEPTPAIRSFLSIFLQLQLHTRLGQSREPSTLGLRGHLGKCFSKRVLRNTGSIRCSR